MTAISQTDIPVFPLRSRGKVRDIYDVDDSTLLIVTTDRISAFDVILPDPIPDKGKILNQITLFWMERFAGLVKNHVLAYKAGDLPEPLAPFADQLAGRYVLARKAEPLPIECIVRGYITGSGWKDYQNTGAVSGHVLPKDLKESDMLAEPLFTPSTKAELGLHDENITTTKAADMLGREVFDKVQELSLSIYSAARDYARERGILIADTKFEFGLVDNELVLIDEVLTPDSSRFWPADGYAPGRSQPSFDKQYVRDWLTSVGFNKQPPAPAMPQEVQINTRTKYLEAFTRLTGSQLDGTWA